MLLVAACCGSVMLQARPSPAQNQGGVPANPLGPFTESVERRRAEQELRSLPLKLRERRERNLTDPKILEQMNELEAAKVMLGGLLATGRIRDPEERRFLEGRLQLLEERLKPGAKR